MSIARAFTTKRAKRDALDAPQRSLATKQSVPITSIRNKISSPVGLISTTNMLSYNAPNIYPSLTSPSSSSNSTSEASDSDHKSISSVSTPPSSPDTEKASPEPNHLSCYFNGPAYGLSPAKSSPDLKETAAASAPKIPTRAPSHTKRNHETSSHKRSTSKSSSLSHKASAPAIGMGHRTSSSALRTSFQIFNNLHQQAATANSNTQSSQPSTTIPPQLYTHKSSTSQDSQVPTEPLSKPRSAQIQGLPSKPNQQVPPVQSQAPRSKSKSRTRSGSQPQFQQHPNEPLPQIQNTKRESPQAYTPNPFSKELAQVTELAEEYSGGQVAFVNEEMAVMAQRGLCRFAAEDYIGEIRDLFSATFGEVRGRGRDVGRVAEKNMGAMWI